MLPGRRVYSDSRSHQHYDSSRPGTCGARQISLSRHPFLLLEKVATLVVYRARTDIAAAGFKRAQELRRRRFPPPNQTIANGLCIG